MNFVLPTSTDTGSATIALAASATTDGMDITIQARTAGVQNIEFWMSESATGIGLTGDTYSGALTAATGTILNVLTAKKHINVQTDATGLAVLLLVDSANPVDQYACVTNHSNGMAIVSAISAANWEGA